MQLPVSLAKAVGLSFYTLNALSYLTDLFQGKIEHRMTLAETALFLSFFPTVTSGPLLRADAFSKEMRKEKPLSYETVRDGFLLVLVGYVMKLVIAGRCALLVNTVYADETLRGFPVVLAVVFYSLAGFAFLYFLTAAFLLPETKGRTLEEIEKMWEKK